MLSCLPPVHADILLLHGLGVKLVIVCGATQQVGVRPCRGGRELVHMALFACTQCACGERNGGHCSLFEACLVNCRISVWRTPACHVLPALQINAYLQARGRDPQIVGAYRVTGAELVGPSFAAVVG